MSLLIYILARLCVHACVSQKFACVCACACDSLSFSLRKNFLLLAPLTARHFLTFSVTFCTQGDFVIIHMFVLYIDACFVIHNDVYMFACMYAC